MRNLAILISCLSIISCISPQNKNVKFEKKDPITQAKLNDSIRLKHLDDSILFSRFIKWIIANDTIYINDFFKTEIIESPDKSYIRLKTETDRLSLKIEKLEDDRFNQGFWIHIDITRSDCNELDFTTEEISAYDVSFPYFKLTMTDNNNHAVSQIFKYNPLNDDYDIGFIKTILDHKNDKILIEEYFIKENKGHFEGEKEPEDKKVRSFYLSDNNKQAVIESFKLFQILNK